MYMKYIRETVNCNDERTFRQRCEQRKETFVVAGVTEVRLPPPRGKSDEIS
jgi:hypothetical protein